MIFALNYLKLFFEPSKATQDIQNLIPHRYAPISFCLITRAPPRPPPKVPGGEALRLRSPAISRINRSKKDAGNFSVVLERCATKPKQPSRAEPLASA